MPIRSKRSCPTRYTQFDDESAAWSTRTMGDRHGVGKDTVARIWKARNLRPWRVETFKLSTDPNFETKPVDVVGLFLDPPERAVVFSFDERTQCPALDRTQPSSPIKLGLRRGFGVVEERVGESSERRPDGGVDATVDPECDGLFIDSDVDGCAAVLEFVEIRGDRGGVGVGGDAEASVVSGSFDPGSGEGRRVGNRDRQGVRHGCGHQVSFSCGGRVNQGGNSPFAVARTRHTTPAGPPWSGTIRWGW